MPMQIARRSFIAGMASLIAAPASAFTIFRSGISPLQPPDFVKRLESRGYKQIIIDGSNPEIMIKWTHDGAGTWTPTRFNV